ncbi:MAG: hypothetical protein AMK75_04230 [Planctomycetes bacterium SM23_65]|nr:MAG: hypothetical protein AMK75_04230 [Planctomycetes bacterium SM23_65]
MPRTARASQGGICYHVLNRGNHRELVFEDDSDYEAFVDLTRRGCDRIDMRVLGYCVMPNHFHMALWPHGDGDLGRWMQWLLTSHVRRHNKRYDLSGRVWQGRFKAFPVKNDEHLTTVLRYIERNPVRAGLVAHARDWPWSSHRWWTAANRLAFLFPTEAVTNSDWPQVVDAPQSQSELDALRLCIQRGRPYGDDVWVGRTAAKLGLEFTLNAIGRPRKAT